MSALESESCVAEEVARVVVPVAANVPSEARDEVAESAPMVPEYAVRPPRKRALPSASNIFPVVVVADCPSSNT